MAITLLANVAGTVSGDFSGIVLDSGDITTSGNGVITLNGTGGNQADNHGVVMQLGAVVKFHEDHRRRRGNLDHRNRTFWHGKRRRADARHQHARAVTSGRDSGCIGSTAADDGVVIANNAKVESPGTGGTLTRRSPSTGTSGHRRPTGVGVAVGSGGRDLHRPTATFKSTGVGTSRRCAVSTCSAVETSNPQARPAQQTAITVNATSGSNDGLQHG